VVPSDRAGTVRYLSIVYPSIVHTGRVIRLLRETVVVHGSEDDEVETDGKRSRVRQQNRIPLNLFFDRVRRIIAAFRLSIQGGKKGESR
jgi:hypothetical protein